MHLPLPTHSIDFFKDKIDRIRTKFLPSHSPDPFLFPPVPPPKMINFIPATLAEIYKLISASESKQCLLDSIPTFLLKLCFNELGEIITNLVNFSLSEGIFLSSFKQAKKPSLSTDDLNNFRPISNLIFISKILEKVVASRIQSHLSSNALSSSFQSAYRIFHSTETTLLKIHNDLILAMDRGEVISLIFLDSSAAFETVDHSIFLTRLQNWFGLDGLSLDGFSSYLSLRSQAVSIIYSFSAFSTLSCGVPQGFVLGPLLFTLYTTSLSSVISKNSLKYHLYADDTQLYISFTPTTSALSLETLTTTFNDILSWMNLNKLLLNPSKTEFLLKTTASQIFSSNKLIFQQWYHPSQFLCSQSWLHLWLWHVFLWSNQLCIQILSFSCPRHPSNSSSSSSFYSHCSCKFTCFQQTWLLQFTLLWHLANKSQQTSTLSKFIGTCQYKYFKISTNHTNTQKLHWLPIKQRIDYKTCLLTYKTLTNQQPTYLYKSFIPVTFCFYTIFWFACSFHSICPIITWQKGFLCLWGVNSRGVDRASGIHSPLIPETNLLYQYSVPDSKHTSSK